jgi:hypothetical protein
VPSAYSLLLYEGALRLGWFNTVCEENSYNQTTSGCDADPEALYSYQFGLGAIHTSNFHPCKGGAWTQNMRKLLLEELANPVTTDPSLVTADGENRFLLVCPAERRARRSLRARRATPTAFPTDDRAALLEQYGKFALFDAPASIRSA